RSVVVRVVPRSAASQVRHVLEEATDAVFDLLVPPGIAQRQRPAGDGRTLDHAERSDGILEVAIFDSDGEVLHHRTPLWQRVGRVQPVEIAAAADGKALPADA